MASIYTSTPFSPEEIAALQKPDPQPAYAEMMKKCPVHRGPDGTITLMRMDDIVAVTRRADVLGTGAHGPTMGGARKLIPLDLDGPSTRSTGGCSIRSSPASGPPSSSRSCASWRTS